MEMQMPKVTSCSVTGCAYNTNMGCHAMAITIGDLPDDPACDTYFETGSHGGKKELTAGVGACKSFECKFNQDYECTAAQIKVGMKGQQADCLTFKHQ